MIEVFILKIEQLFPQKSYILEKLQSIEERQDEQ